MHVYKGYIKTILFILYLSEELFRFLGIVAEYIQAVDAAILCVGVQGLLFIVRFGHIRADKLFELRRRGTMIEQSFHTPSIYPHLQGKSTPPKFAEILP